MRMERFSKWQLPFFFLLAYMITWAVQIPAYLFAYERREAFTNETNLLHFFDLFGGELDPAFAAVFLLVTFSFGPSIAGVVTVALFKGADGLREMWRRTVKIAIPPRWVLAVICIPIALSIASVVLGYVLGGMEPMRYSFLVPLGLAIPLLIYMIIFTGLAEELGWRGYALPELQRTRTAERSSWILGILWGLWHLPSNLLTPYLRGDLTVPLAIAILLGLTLGIVGWTIVITWIYNNTGSLFWIIILHGWANTVQSYVVLSAGSYTAQVIYGVLPWAIAVFLLKRYGVATLTGKSEATLVG